MKINKIIIAILLVALAFSATACGKTEEDYNNEITEMKEEYQPALNEIIDTLRAKGFDKEVVVNAQKFDGVTYDGGWDKDNGKWIKQTETVRCTSDGSNPLTDAIAACYNVTENADVISIAKSRWFGEKTYKIELRHVVPVDASKPARVEGTFGDDVKYDWANVKAMRITYITITTKKGNITKIEVFHEDVAVYWSVKSEKDDTKELRADVYVKTSLVATF
jgi:hypothetical protein